MTVDVVARPLAEVEADALVVGLTAGPTALPPRLAALDRRVGGQLKAVLDAEGFSAKAAQVTHLYTAGQLPAARLIVVGLGDGKDATLETIRRAAAGGLRRARDLSARTVAVDLLGERLPAGQRTQAVVEGALLGTYSFDRYKREKNGKAVDALRVVAPDQRLASEVGDGARRGEVFAGATALARDLVNMPANEVHPTHLARVAAQIAKEARLRLRVWEGTDCQKMGMGAFLAVAAGSEQPPKFIHLTYTPGRPRRRVALVGKGITFDAGGLDLKTAEGMLRMKDDMSGAAAVLGLFQALPRLKPPVEVHGLIAATENMPSGTAQRPGDIVRAMNGLTIEIGNTDAEGRLTLADALAYAVKHVKPDEMIDLATLTGAVVIALGQGVSGVMASDDGLASRVLAAADGAGERMWRLPLHDEYKDGLKSDVADLNNISSQRGAGAIVAGLFMREFTAGVPWAHLDIAGTAFTERELPLGPKGATGVGVRTLLAYLSNGRR
jgi:leucyl aminopeptidase